MITEARRMKTVEQSSAWVYLNFFHIHTSIRTVSAFTGMQYDKVQGHRGEEKNI